MNDLIKKWDDELIEKHIGTEINYLRDFFGDKNVTKLSYIDIGANVGKFYDVLSKEYEIEKVVMVEPAPQLNEYIKEKFQSIPNCIIYDYAISDRSGKTFFQTHSIEHSTPDHINMGVSQIHKSEGYEVQMISGYDFFDQYVNDLESFDFIKIDAETQDYQILKSMMPLIQSLNKKPFILFENNYQNQMSKEDAKKILDDFTDNCGYEPINIDELFGDSYLKPLS
jgi:FkbM family methyltransferase